MARANGELTAEIVTAVRACAPDGRCVVALGGGADSGTLLAVAADALGHGNVRALFVDHGLEGSAALRVAAELLCETLNIPLSVLAAPVDDGADLESRARTARYAAMEFNLSDTEVAFTAHTRDDQAETVVMRLMRGSGSAGLSGIPGERGQWRRPLLEFTKSELRSIADDRRLPYENDPANTDDRFLRSRIRSRVIPTLEAEFGQSIADSLARSASLLETDDAALETEAADVDLILNMGRVLIPSAPLATISAAVSSRVARRALRQVLGGYPGTALDAATIVACATTGVGGNISSGLAVVNDGPYVAVGAPPRPEPEVLVEVGSKFSWQDDRYRVYTADGAPRLFSGGRFTVLGAGAMSGTLIGRGFEHGDRIDLGVGASPVKEVLRTHGVPAWRRPVSLLILDGAKIAAVVGMRTARWASSEPGEAVVVIEREVTT